MDSRISLIEIKKQTQNKRSQTTNLAQQAKPQTDNAPKLCEANQTAQPNDKRALAHKQLNNLENSIHKKSEKMPYTAARPSQLWSGLFANGA